MSGKNEIITLGAGCFWGVEHILKNIEGVKSTKSGYMGGAFENPRYEDICTKLTGHAEVVQVLYDAEIITLETILDYFWRLHDPTQLNRQGADIGPQYRSVIFYHEESQKKISIDSKDKFDRKKIFKSKAVTEISPAQKFYTAEEYHQSYYDKKYENLNGEGPICHFLRDE